MYNLHEKPIATAVIVAAGNANRMKGIDKITYKIGGLPVIVRTVLAFCKEPRVRDIVVVTRPDLLDRINRLMKKHVKRFPVKVVAGGSSRQQSVAAGVGASDNESELLLIHDGVRPFVSPKTVSALCDLAKDHGAACVGVRVTETVKRVDDAGYIKDTVPRNDLFCAQTPQVFKADLYKNAMQLASEQGRDYTDDCLLVEAMGHPIYMYEGDRNNIKITTPEDITFAKAILRAEKRKKK